MTTWLFHLSDFDGTVAGDVGGEQSFSSSTAQNIHNMDPAKEAGKGRLRTYLACRQWWAFFIIILGIRPWPNPKLNFLVVFVK
jgi:hypothetical protein